MKRLFGILVIGGLVASCGKENVFSNDFGTAAFINTSTSTPASGINVFVDTIQQTASGLAYRANSGYLSVRPGTRNVELRSITNGVTTKYWQSNENLPSNTAYTYFIYDTLATGATSLRTLRLNDTLTTAANGFFKARFVNVAPRSVAMDVTMLRTSATPNDSVTIFNVPYVGATPTAAAIQAMSAFRTLPLGAYTVKLKAAGTQTVLASANYSVANLSGTANQTGIVTFYAAGTTQSAPLTVNLFRHYP